MTGFQSRGVGSQQSALSIEHECVDGRAQVHGCYSQVLSAGIHLHNVHDSKLHQSLCCLHFDWLHFQHIRVRYIDMTSDSIAVLLQPLDSMLSVLKFQQQEKHTDENNSTQPQVRVRCKRNRY